MNKFTRALTREIEVQGERLAVTLDEQGMSMRPVGSRKPPRSLSWASLVCALCGKLPDGADPTDDELAAAFKVMRASGKSEAATPAQASAPSPSGPPQTHSGSELEIALRRLDAWLGEHRPRFEEGLEPGATPEQLADLEQKLGLKLPPELRTLLEWHNGQDPDLIGGFMESFRLLSVEEILEEYEELVNDKDGHWKKTWIPFLADGQGDFVFMDAAEKGHPVRESWRGKDATEVGAPSLTDWVNKFLKDLEADKYHEDPERGDFIRAR